MHTGVLMQVHATNAVEVLEVDDEEDSLTREAALSDRVELVEAVSGMDGKVKPKLVITRLRLPSQHPEEAAAGADGACWLDMRAALCRLTCVTWCNRHGSGAEAVGCAFDVERTHAGVAGVFQQCWCQERQASQHGSPFCTPAWRHGRCAGASYVATHCARVAVLGVLAREESVVSSVVSEEGVGRRKSSTGQVVKSVATVPHKIADALGVLKLSGKGSSQSGAAE